jgi:hypothetical protein
MLAMALQGAAEKWASLVVSSENARETAVMERLNVGRSRASPR